LRDDAGKTGKEFCMNVLVTGVPGWLGTRFLEILVHGFEEGQGPALPWDRIRCVVEPGAETREIEELSPRIEIARADITQNALHRVCEGMDVLFHIAGIIHPPIFHVRRVYDINTRGTRHLLHAAADCGVRRFVYVSSNSPAGLNPSAHEPFTEESPYRPYMNYGLSKYYAELEVRAFHDAGRIETVILRPCWFYGPCQPARQTRFFKMIGSGKPVVFGSGLNLRSMSYVDNTCQALILAARSEKAAGNLYWIADRRPYSMLEIYETVADLLGVTLKPRFVPGALSELFQWADGCLQSFGLYEMNIHVAGEMNKNIACRVDKAARDLGYSPSIELREGMRRSIEWCRRRGLLA